MNSLKEQAEIIFQNSNRKKRNYNEMTNFDTTNCSNFIMNDTSKRYKLDQDGNYQMSYSQKSDSENGSQSEK